MKTVRFLRPAELEMLDAARYYELQAIGLGDDFLDKIDSAVQDIAERPERWPVVQFNIRRRLIHRFPYALLGNEFVSSLPIERNCLASQSNIRRRRSL